MKRAALALTALALIAPSSAHGVDLDAHLAFNYWHKPRACKPASVRVVASELGSIGGEAREGACLRRHRSVWLRVNASLDPQHRCAAVFHEYGHLLGKRHSPDPASIMYPTLLTIPAACVAAHPSPPTVMAVAPSQP